jgi:hypothetical protein
MQYGKIPMPVGEIGQKLSIPGERSFADLFSGALKIETGDGSKRLMTKNASDLEKSRAYHTYG